MISQVSLRLAHASKYSIRNIQKFRNNKLSTMSSNQPIQILLIGKRASVGHAVTEVIAPEMDVKEFFTDKDSMINKIPEHLKNPSGIQAIVMGGGITPDERDEIRSHVAGREGLKQVPFLSADPKLIPDAIKNHPPTDQVLDDYAKEVGHRLKKWVLDKKEEGVWKGETGGDTEVYLF